MKKTFNKIILLILALYVGFNLTQNFGYRNVERIKKHSEKTFLKSGFEIVGYEGYQWRIASGGSVWYILERKDGETGVLYNACLHHWKGEYHIYNLNTVGYQ